MSSDRRRIVVVGFGLIGGSLGLCLRRAGFFVAYVDPAVDLESAQRRDAAAERLDSIRDVRADDVVAVATPVDVALQILPEMARSGATVTTLCSVMRPFASADRVVAGHPFAGSERSGFDAADENLFRGKKWFLDSSRESEIVDDVVRATGAEILRIDPAQHDEALAYTSHLPQLISTALASLIETRGLDSFAGSGLKTLLRLAGSDESVWRPIFEANGDLLREATREFDAAVDAVLRDDSGEEFRKAQELWRKLNA